MKHLEVVGAVIVYDGKVLCMQRGEGKYPYVSLKYEFPGGKVEAGETHPEALMRELREEMNFDVSITEDDYLTTVNHKYPDFEITMYCYLCHPTSPEFTRKEHINHVWALPNEMMDLDWAPADIPVAKLVSKRLTKKKRCTKTSKQ